MTIISIRLGGEAAIFAGTMILTVVVLIFAEVTPKTIAARHPSKLALPAALIYYPLLKIAYPLVWIISFLANNLLKLLGFGSHGDHDHALSEAELRTLVTESASLMPRRHQRMLLSILDLGEVTVDDVMVRCHEGQTQPRSGLIGQAYDLTQYSRSIPFNDVAALEADLPRLAASRPGQVLRFAFVDAAEGERLARAAEAQTRALLARLGPLLEGGVDETALYAANLVSGAVHALSDEFRPAAQTVGPRG